MLAMTTYMKGMHSNFVECPPIEIHKQSLNNNVIIQESEDERPPWFSCKRTVIEESGGAILDTNNDIALIIPVVGTPTDISRPKSSSPVMSPKELCLEVWLNQGDWMSDLKPNVKQFSSQIQL